MMDEKQITEDKQQTTNESTTLKAELEKCKKEAEEYLNGWKRAKADYINLKNEVEKEKAELVAFASVGLLIQILPIYDGLKRACAKVNTIDDKWAEGIVNIKKQFEGFFKSLKIEEIKTVGEKFNPEVHEAVSREKKEGVEAGMVLEEVSGGYMMNERVIIPAKVVVSE